MGNPASRDRADDLVERALELLRAGGRATDRTRDAMIARLDRLQRLLLQREVRRSREPAGGESHGNPAS
jgi:hypothetical protein